MPGNTVVPFDTAKPRPMSPCLSSAMLPIQRSTVSLGEYVPCWKIENVVPTRRISYQRTPAMLGLDCTDWLVTNDSKVGNLRQASRKSGRCRTRKSIFCDVPGCGMQSRPVPGHGKVELNAAVCSIVSSLSVALGVAQLTVRV